MREYNVKDVTKQGSLTIVQLGSHKAPLLLEKEILPGCIQHIIVNIIKEGKKSNDVCDRMCDILCNTYMNNDDSSRKTEINNFFPMLFIADSKDAFREFKGVEVLIELLKKNKSAPVAKALTHVLTGNGNSLMRFFFLSAYFLK